MRVFLTGGTGFIGGRLARMLVREGHQVTALARPTSDTRALEELGARIAPGDVTDPASIERAMEGAQAVYHVAAWYEIGAADPKAVERTNVGGTRNVLSEAVRRKVPRILYCSSAIVLGPSHGRPADESQVHPGDFGSAYEETKVSAHQVARALIGQGAPIRIAIPATVYGPGDRSLVGTLLKAFVQGQVRVGGVPDYLLTLTHVEDVARGMMLIAERGRNGEEYVLGGQITAIRDWLDLLADLTGIAPPLFYAPHWLLRALAPLYPLVARPLKLPPNLHREGLKMYRSEGWAVTSAKAERELGWSVRPLDAGMAEAVAWYQARYAPRRPLAPRSKRAQELIASLAAPETAA